MLQVSEFDEDEMRAFILVYHPPKGKSKALHPNPSPKFGRG
jgi:hypothetical protein